MSVTHEQLAANLFLLDELEGASETRKLSESDLNALRTVSHWIQAFVARPNKDLGRAGPVCPFIPGALARKTLWLAPEQVAGRSMLDAAGLISGYQRVLLKAQPTEDDANHKAIVVVFTDLPLDRAQAFFDDLLQQLAVPSYVNDGFMMGGFFKGNAASAIYNASFQPFTSPVPFLLVRLGVVDDWKFLLDDDTWLPLWANRYEGAGARAVAEELRRLPWRTDRDEPAGETKGREPQSAPQNSRKTVMDSASTPEGPGAVSGAPGLPAGFTGTFTSRYIDVGELRLHAVMGGDGPPLLLVHGWPQTWYAWRLVMPALARDFEVIAVDQRGVGLSDKPEEGYDTRTQANDMVALMAALGHERFAMFGTDTGMPIAYAVAADHPDRLERLVVSEAVIAGVTPSPPLLVPGPLNERLWHLAFNRLPKVNEQLVRGREEIFFGAEFSGSAGMRKLPSEVVKYYIDILASDPDRLHGSFGQYRAFDASIVQNQQRKNTRLTLPVLAIGAEEGLGQGVIDTMKLVADDLQSVIIPGSGHWIAEQAPEQLVEALTPFLTPYRGGSSQVAALGATS